MVGLYSEMVLLSQEPHQIESLRSGDPGGLKNHPRPSPAASLGLVAGAIRIVIFLIV